MKMKEKIIIILIVIAIYVCGIITPFVIKNTRKTILKNKVIYEIIVDTEYINLREEIDLSGNIVRKVYKGEKFKVIKYYEGNSYNWYQVLYDEDKIGWLASGKENAWVIVVNE